MAEGSNSNTYLLSNSIFKKHIGRYTDGDIKEDKYSKSSMDYEKILEHLGELGAWQLFHIGMLWLPLIVQEHLL